MLKKQKTTVFVLKVNGFNKKILTIKEIGQESVEIYFKGSSHPIPFVSGTDLSRKNLRKINKSEVIKTQITVHPNLKSKIGSIGINYKFIANGIKKSKRADITNVRLGDRLFPVWTSLGSNVSRKSILIKKKDLLKNSILYLWKDSGLNTKNDSLCYSIFVANKSIEFIVPEDFPRNTFVLKYPQFQLIFVYWLFNQPTKLRGINYYETTDLQEVAKMGYEFHEMLNFTNFMTLQFLNFYPKLPKLT